MRKLIFLLVVSAAIASVYSVDAAPLGTPGDSVATLAGFLKEGLAASPKLQAARVRAQGAGTRIVQAGAWDDPQIGVEFFATPVTSLNPFTEGMETDYFVQQMIPLFGKKSSMAEAAAAGSRVAEQEAAATERALIADIKRAYAMILAAQQRTGVNTESQRLMEQIVASARSRYSVGQASQSDVLKAQVELDQLQNQRAELDQELASAVSMMNALCGRRATSPIGRVADVEPVAIRETEDSLLVRALDNRPELRGMRDELEMNNADLTASRRERVPDLMVRGMYKQMKEGTDQWAAMLSINIPFAPWSSGRTSGKIEENELNVKATEQSLRDMQNMVLAEVRDAWTKTSSHWQQLERYRRSILPQSEAALRSSLSSYQTARTDFLSLLDSYRMVQMLKMDYAMLVGEYLSDVARLERAVGTTLD